MSASTPICFHISFARYYKAGGVRLVQAGMQNWHSTSTVRYYAPNFEREITNGQTTNYTYIESPNGLIAAVKRVGNKQDVMLLATDHLGSIVAVWNASGTLLEEHRYSAWGLRTSSTQNPRLRRGFTGHEHLQQFGLIDMQARLYDPHLGRFLAPDPYVQAPSMSMNFNRYAYCMNNPLKYVDPDGEFWHIVIGAVVGGVLNVVANLDNKDKMGFWDYAAAFVVGAGAGVATAATGGAAGAGFWATTGVAAACGAVTSATNSVISQTGKNFSGMENVKWGDVGKAGLVGGASGFMGSAAGYWAASSSLLVNGVNSPFLRSAIVSPLAAGVGHVAAGTTAGMINGENFDKAFANSFDGIWKSMLVGGGVGIASTVALNFANGINPFNGQMMWPKNNGFADVPELTSLKEGTLFDRYGDESGSFAAPAGTSFEERSLPVNYQLKELNTYKVVKPLPAYRGTTAKSLWFNSPGGGIQYKFDYNIEYLLKNGYIIRVP